MGLFGVLQRVGSLEPGQIVGVLARRGWKALFKQCCCFKYRCEPDGENRCGDPKQKCVPDDEGPYSSPFCNRDCPDPPEQCCIPPCGPCEVCEPNCSKCPENPLGCCSPKCVYQCSECEYCDGDACRPLCPPESCQTCVNGECESTCGPCEVCIDGTCVGCPDGTTCVDGVCIPPPPKQYYCCLDEVEPPSEGEPTPPPTASCHYGPCGKIVGGVFIPKPEWTVGGPYAKPEDCAEACRPHDCVPDPCGGSSCIPSGGGQYLSLEKCREAGECDDITDGPCGLSVSSPQCYSGEGAGTVSYFFGIGPAENLPICVSYKSLCEMPIRVQIWAPLLAGDGCTELAERVIVCDSGWRGSKGCNCNFDPPGGFKGGSEGVCKWRTKQRYVRNFEVRVLTECPENKWIVCVSCGDCAPIPEQSECCEPCLVAVGEEVIDIHDLLPSDSLSVSWNGQSVPPGSYLQTFPGFPDNLVTFPVWTDYWASIQVDQTLDTGHERWLSVSTTIVGEFVGDCNPPALEGDYGSSGGIWKITRIKKPALGFGDEKPICRITGRVQVLEKWEDRFAVCGGIGVFHKTHAGIYQWTVDIEDKEVGAPDVKFVCGARITRKDGPEGCVAEIEQGEFTGAPSVELNILP